MDGCSICNKAFKVKEFPNKKIIESIMGFASLVFGNIQLIRIFNDVEIKYLLNIMW